MKPAGPLIVASLALGGCAVASGQDTAAQAAMHGHQVARRVCAACHSVEPGGVSPRPRAPPFGSREMRATAGLEDRLAELTSRGHYGMPVLVLRPGEVHDLRAYIESLDAH